MSARDDYPYLTAAAAGDYDGRGGGYETPPSLDEEARQALEEIDQLRSERERLMDAIAEGLTDYTADVIVETYPPDPRRRLRIPTGIHPCGTGPVVLFHAISIGSQAGSLDPLA